jgi:integrase
MRNDQPEAGSRCGEPLRALIRVGLYIGLRAQSEALTLPWADVDLRRGLLTGLATP